jgi:hypothetical protein
MAVSLRLTLCLVAAAALGSVSATAQAAPPTVEVMPFELIEVVAPGEALALGTNPCPFTVTVHHQGTFVARTFFAADGTPIRQLIHSAHFTETYSANGRSLTTTSTASVLISIDSATGDILITGRGNQRHLTVAGVGLVLAQAGHFLLDSEGNLIDVSGLNIPAGNEFCAALTP